MSVERPNFLFIITDPHRAAHTALKATQVPQKSEQVSTQFGIGIR